MAVNDVLSQLQRLIQGSTPKLIEVTDQPKTTVPFVPGERYTAKVQEQIASGRYLVLIRDQKLELNLPRNTQAGQNVELRFVSASPRLTFLLAGEAAAGQAQGPVNLSDSSRYLNALLDRVKDLATRQPQPQSQSPSATSAKDLAAQLTTAKPIINGAPPSVAQFASLLKDTVIKSGLFYESHQAQWAAGNRPLADLLREPQGRLSEPRAFTAVQQSTVTQQTAPTPAATAPAAATAAGQSVKVDLPNTSAATAQGATANTAEPVHPKTAPLVQQQLETLDQRQIMWQGQVWPGQEMRWQIEERAAQDEDQDTGREWQTRLDLSLPHLGQINALLKFTPQGIRIELTAPTTDTVQTLQNASLLLNQGMERAGLHLIEMKVEAHDGSA